MAFNGSGTFNLPTGNPVVVNTTIDATVHNNTNSEIATGLSNCVTRDGQSLPTGNLPMGGYKLTGLAAGSGNGESVRYEQTVLKTGSTGSAILPAGTTAEEGTGADGYLRFDTTLQVLRAWYGSAWNTIVTTANAVLTSGNQTIAGIKTFSDSVIATTSQVGSSPTATNNFVFATNGAGGMTLKNGAGTSVMVTDSTLVPYLVGATVYSQGTAYITGSNTIDQFVDCGLTLPLTVGTWLINYSGSMVYVLGAGGNVNAGLAVRTTSATDSTIVAGSLATGIQAVASVTTYGRSSGIFRLVVATNATYHIGFGAVTISGSPTITSCSAEGRAAYGLLSASATRIA